MPSIENLKVDYFVTGAGAMGLAFTVVIIDRRPAPGGHWNDAYPFGC
ncbi:MAG: hypothetical protein ACI8Y4_004623 [Candidatus Poriferisodalaceae bacterium]|jgi:hypothetical protein